MHAPSFLPDWKCFFSLHHDWGLKAHNHEHNNIKSLIKREIFSLFWIPEHGAGRLWSKAFFYYWSRHCCQFRSCFFGGLDPAACHLDLTTTQSWWQFQEVCMCVRLRFSHTPSNPFDSLIHRETTALFSMPLQFSLLFSSIPPTLLRLLLLIRLEMCMSFCRGG